MPNALMTIALLVLYVWIAVLSVVWFLQLSTLTATAFVPGGVVPIG